MCIKYVYVANTLHLLIGAVQTVSHTVFGFCCFAEFSVMQMFKSKKYQAGVSFTNLLKQHLRN